MPEATVGQLDQLGIIKDLPAYNLPVNAFSDGENVVFDQGGVRPGVKERDIYPEVLFDPWKIEAAPIGKSQTVWFYLGAQKAALISSFQHFDVTRISGDYTANIDIGWNGGFFQGIPIFNNGFDVPQQADPNNLTTPLIDLENWPATLRVEVLRPFGTFLIGLIRSSLSDPGIFDRQTLVWSDTADPGTVPDNWDFDDPASKAGVKTFSDKGDRLIDCLPLRNENIIYKEDSIHRMRFIGGTLVFAFSLLFDEIGILSQDCVVAFGNRHFFLSTNDMYVHNGIEILPVATRRMKDTFFKELDPVFKDRTFVKHYDEAQQIWICYCTVGNSRCNRALIWNYEEDNFTIRDLPQISDIAKGVLDAALLVTWASVNESWETPGLLESEEATWDSSSVIWDADVTWGGQPDSITWGFQSSPSIEFSLIMATDIQGVAAVYNPASNTSEVTGVTYAGSHDRPPMWHVPTKGARFQGRVLRIGLAISGSDQEGNPTVNRTLQKTFTEFWPEIEGRVEIRFGSQETAKSEVVWKAWEEFDSNLDDKLDLFITTKFLAIEVRGMTGSDEDWLYSGYQLLVAKGGRY